MPSLPFVLPHWLYWATLVVFPLVAMYFVARQRKLGSAERCLAVRRLYVLAVLRVYGSAPLLFEERVGLHIHPSVSAHSLHERRYPRASRGCVAHARGRGKLAHVEVNRAKPSAGETPTAEATDRLAKAQAAASRAEADFKAEPRPNSSACTAIRVARFTDGRDAGR